MGNLWELFENMDEIVYVADIETYDLVYMNKKALDAFGFESLEKVKGEKCYHILQNSDVPCTFCDSHRLKLGSFNQRRYFNPHLNKHFLLRNTLLKENGRLYRLEMALDISVLEQQRIYIFEKDETGRDDNTYQLAANEMASDKEKLQKWSNNVLYALNVDYLGIYQVDFDTDKCQIYREIERIRENQTINFADSYQAAMEGYISTYVVPRDQEQLRAVLKKDYVMGQLRTKKKFCIRYQVKDNLQGVKNLEVHFSSTGKGTAENSALFAFRDINSVVEQEETYKRETKRELEDILGGSRTGIWTIELEEGCPPRLYADRTMQMLLGVNEEIGPEECYQSWFNNIDAEYIDTVLEAVQEILKTGRSEVVYPWNHPTLGKIYVRCGGVPNKKFRKPGVCLNGYHQDITEVMVTRKRQEQAIMELLEKVSQTNSVKSEFLSHMSHDLRTPINGILGMLTIMEKSQDDLEKQKECREKIRVSTEHLLSLVNDVLEVSKLDSGRLAKVEEPFDLLDSLENCITILSPKAEEGDIRLVLNEVDLHHRKLVGNPLYIERILVNIIDNGIKYNRPNGSVYVQVKELSCKDSFAKYQFVIEDTGIGIGDHFKQHIFDLFAQEDQGARTNYNGVGLGMCVVKKLVDQLEGTIEVESQLGKGSVFRVTLPIQIDAKWDVQPMTVKKNVSADISGMHVLLVEDNEINCEIVKFVLEEANATVVTAKDGKVAVDTFAASGEGTFDCVLMDLMMPVMSGFEATRVIRSLNRTDAKTIPIIALSANAFEEDVAMAKDAGMNEHLAKPVDMNKMLMFMCRLRNWQGTS